MRSCLSLNGDGVRAVNPRKDVIYEERLSYGYVETSAALPPAHAFFRDLARDFVTALCAEPAFEELRHAVDLVPRQGRLEELARAVPPMRGAESVTPENLGHLWQDTQRWFKRDFRKYRGTVASYLQAKNQVWNLVGRVYFHLAENKASTEAPFAFLATYTTRVSAQAKPQHRPLGKAVEESAWAEDRRALPVLIEGRKITTTFWGKAWCDNLESYSDYADRLPRGRSYVRSGAIVHLEIGNAKVEAFVRGSSTYTVKLVIKALSDARL